MRADILRFAIKSFVGYKRQYRFALYQLVAKEGLKISNVYSMGACVG
jgi:hypothetical protein